MSKHEHLHVDISPAALNWISHMLDGASAHLPFNSMRIEVENFVSECRARVQHAAAGEPDISELQPMTATRARQQTEEYFAALPGRSADEDWLS